MVKGFINFLFLDKNDPREDAGVPNADRPDPFTSWGKNVLESLNRNMDYSGAYVDTIFSYADKCSPIKDIYIPNIDTFIPFASGGKNPPDRGNRIPVYFAAYSDIFGPF